MGALFELLLLALIVCIVLFLVSKFLPKDKSVKVTDYNPDKMFEEVMKHSDNIVLHCDSCGKKLVTINGPHEVAYSKEDGSTIHAEYNVSCECHKYCYRLIYDNGKSNIRKTNSI